MHDEKLGHIENSAPETSHTVFLDELKTCKKGWLESFLNVLEWYCSL